MCPSGYTRAQLDLIRELFSQCERRSVRFWLFGGWGIDALLGRVSRDHSDIDILLHEAPRDAMRSVLEEMGGAVGVNHTGLHLDRNGIGMDIGFLLTHSDGTVVSDTDENDPNVYPWPAGSFPEECNGPLPGLRCRAISWEAQYVAKAGFKNAFPNTTPRGKDEADLERIAEHVAADRRSELEETVFGGIPREPVSPSQIEGIQS